VKSDLDVLSGLRGINLDRLDLDIEAERCRRKLATFVKHAWPIVEPGEPLQWNWHIDAICDHLQAVTEGDILRIVINIPPGHMKSMLVSVLWPAWEWTREPHIRSQYGSYDESLALRDSTKTRDIINSDWYQTVFQPNWIIKRDSNAKGYFVNSLQGFRRTFAINGKVTGHRGNKVAVDDPLNARDQFNTSLKAQCLNLWDQVLSTRVNDPRTGRFVLVMQRLADDDLAGHLLRRNYEFLILPSRFEPERRYVTSIGWTDPRKEAGELLFPDRYDAPSLDRLENESLGPDGFAGQHQQRPVKQGGARFQRGWFNTWKWDGALLALKRTGGEIEYYRLEQCSIFATVDVAASEKKSADYTVYWICAVTPVGDLVILQEVRQRMDEVKSIAKAKELQENWPRLRYFVVEQNGVGNMLIANMVAQGLAVRPVHINQDKWAMSVTAVVRAEAGKIFLPASTPETRWADEALEEITLFPAAQHDDRVTTLSLAANALFDVMPSISGAKSVPIPKSENRRSDLQTSDSDKDRKRQTGTSLGERLRQR